MSNFKVSYRQRLTVTHSNSPKTNKTYVSSASSSFHILVACLLWCRWFARNTQTSRSDRLCIFILKGSISNVLANSKHLLTNNNYVCGHKRYPAGDLMELGLRYLGNMFLTLITERLLMDRILRIQSHVSQTGRFSATRK